MIQEAIQSALEGVGKAELAFVGMELKHLPSILRDGELPERIVAGRFRNAQGILVATDRRLIFFDKGLLGSTVAEYPYRSITSIEHGAGLMMGEIRITVAGNVDKIDQIFKEHVQGFVELVRAKMEQAQSSAAPAPAVPDLATQLQQLADLRDRGALTDEQFEAAKKRLLGA